MSNAKDLPIFNANHQLNIPLIGSGFKLAIGNWKCHNFALFSSSEHKEVNYA